MQEVSKKVQTHKRTKQTYTKFEKLDGSHPIKKLLPDGFVDYPARLRKGGKLRFFNFDLAKNMGLISKDHENKLNSQLEQKVIETFGLIIINEYDQLKHRTFPKDQIKSGTYMATRYLQLQHDNKAGKNSGDGRSIWNGQISNRGKIWDVSSCGTGATRLSPATSKYNKFFENGDPTVSYGCGFAEVDEGMAQALFSEVFYQNNVTTERVLAIIEFEKGYAINVRAHECLLRPSHFFLYLKQNNLPSLKILVDYYIDTKRKDLKWTDCPQNDSKYDYLLKYLSQTFAKMAAQFESKYIFCWLDWDGDNILMDGGIIDYGSIRQFGLFHSEYRYDDEDRFSTSILEQREKARYIVQSFAQMIDFIQNHEKKSIGSFKKHWSLNLFDETFEECKNHDILYQIGFSLEDAQYLLKYHKKKIREFRKVYAHFERAKSKAGQFEVSDGITWDAIFCMRDIMRELPQMLIARKAQIENEEFLDIIKSKYATDKDLELNAYRKKMIKSFQDIYIYLIKASLKNSSNSLDKQLLEISKRSLSINKMEKVTGDSIALIVSKILKKKNQFSADQIYSLIKDFSEVQNVKFDDTPTINESTKSMLKQFFEIVKEYREGL